MNLENLKKIYTDYGCEKIYVKALSPNDNSKNQVYFGGSFQVLNILPISDIKTDDVGDWRRERFKATIKFSWITNDGHLTSAPNAQLILYPKYPEVRFSGFLAGCENAPSEIMASRNPGRLLFLSVNHDGKILGYAASPESRISKEFHSLTNLDKIGVFDTILLSKVVNNKERLIDELRRINQKGWIDSKRLDANGNVLDCNSSNCGGYTLEAELGIRPNGFSEPDYLGWEVKQFAVPAFDRINTGIITLMTPEPTGGIYVKSGVKDFISKYGYEDLRGRLNRKNFGGVHKVNIKHNRTSLTLMLPGFDHEKCKITDAGGSISLVDVNGNIAAEWSFSSMIKHWNRKHNQACYVPSRSLVSEMRKYYYGNKIILGEETDFQFFLKEMAVGNIYYDPGIKMEEIDGKIKVKRRSQFRIKSINLGNLYKQTATTLL